MTARALAFGNMLLIFGAFIPLSAAILSDGSYLISSATRPPRLKHPMEYGENGGGGRTPTDGQKSYRQSPTRALQDSTKYTDLEQKTWSFDKKHNFFNALKPVARNFLLKNHVVVAHHGSPSSSLSSSSLSSSSSSSSSSSLSSSAASRDKRNHYMPDDEPFSNYDDIYSQNEIQDVGENVIEENPKSQRNHNYYPYRGKRPFEVPQIGEYLSSSTFTYVHVRVPYA